MWKQRRTFSLDFNQTCFNYLWVFHSHCSNQHTNWYLPTHKNQNPLQKYISFTSSLSYTHICFSTVIHSSSKRYKHTYRYIEERRDVESFGVIIRRYPTSNNNGKEGQWDHWAINCNVRACGITKLAMDQLYHIKEKREFYVAQQNCLIHRKRAYNHILTLFRV